MTTKAKVYMVLEVLREYSDEKHPLVAEKICEKIDEKYRFLPERRSIYGAVNFLEELGYDIVKIGGGCRRGYYLRERQFEPEEARLLINAVYNFPFISEHQTKDLVNKLQQDFSVYDRRAFEDFTIIKPDIKTLNKDVFYNISIIAESIEKRKKMSFTYLEYGSDLKLKPRRNNHYTVNPYGTVYLNEHYYLACSYSRSHKVTLYRIDMMKDVVVRDYDVDDPLPKAEIRKAIDSAVYAQVGSPESFTLRFDKKYIRDVVDKFGTNIITYEDGNYIQATVHSTHMGMIYWALQYIQHVEVVSPASFRQELIDILKKSPYTEAAETK